MSWSDFGVTTAGEWSWLSIIVVFITMVSELGLAGRES